MMAKKQVTGRDLMTSLEACAGSRRRIDQPVVSRLPEQTGCEQRSVEKW